MSIQLLRQCIDNNYVHNERGESVTFYQRNPDIHLKNWTEIGDIIRKPVVMRRTRRDRRYVHYIVEDPGYPEMPLHIFMDIIGVNSPGTELRHAMNRSKEYDFRSTLQAGVWFAEQYFKRYL